MNRRRPLVLAASIVAVALVCVPIALAGKKPGGGGTTGGSYTITLSPTGSYYFGESVYATTNVPASLGPFISMKCYQNGVLVGTTDHAAFPGGWYYGWAFSLRTQRGMDGRRCGLHVHRDPQRHRQNRHGCDPEDPRRRMTRF